VAGVIGQALPSSTPLNRMGACRILRCPSRSWKAWCRVRRSVAKTKPLSGNCRRRPGL